MSGQIRIAIDCLFALKEVDGNLLCGYDRASALLMAVEGHGFEDALTYFDHLMEHFGGRIWAASSPEATAMWAILGESL